MPFAPDPSAQNISSVSYGKEAIVTTPTELSLVAGYVSNYVGASKSSAVDYTLSFNPSAISKKSTFTVAVPTPTAGDTVERLVTDGSADPKTKKYIYSIQAGDTEAEIASGLAAFATTNPFISVSANVTASPAVFTVQGVIPGQNYTLAISKTGVSATLSAITTVNAAVGTANVGKVFSISVEVSTSDDGHLQFKPTLRSFDGAAIPLLLNTVNLAHYKHTKSLKELQAARGF